MQAEYCPCTKTECSRHGNCVECVTHHEGETYCKRNLVCSCPRSHCERHGRCAECKTNHNGDSFCVLAARS